MDKLKENPFWTGIGVAGLVLVLVWYFLVYPAWAEADTHKNAIKFGMTPLQGPIQSDTDIKKWEERRDVYNGDYKSILDYYSKMDAELEKWFPGQSNPDSTTFTTAYNDARKNLESMLIGNDPDNPVIAIGIEEDDLGGGFEGEDDPTYGFNWEKMTPDAWTAIGADSRTVVKLLQKRFWIRKRIAEVAATIKGKDDKAPSVKRIRDVRFFQQLHKDFRVAVPYGNGVLEPYPKDPRLVRGSMRANRFQELALPNELGTTISFGFCVDMMYGDLAQFIREFLRPQREPKLLVEITAIRTYVIKSNQNAVSTDVPWYQGKDDPDSKRKAFEQDIKPGPMTVQFSCRVVDFDAEKAKGDGK